MATIVETNVWLRVEMRRDMPEGPYHVRIKAESYDARGKVVRTYDSDDIYESLPLARQGQVQGILADAMNYIKAQMEIA